MLDWPHLKIQMTFHRLISQEVNFVSPFTIHIFHSFKNNVWHIYWEIIHNFESGFWCLSQMRAHIPVLVHTEVALLDVCSQILSAHLICSFIGLAVSFLQSFTNLSASFLNFFKLLARIIWMLSQLSSQSP